MLFKSLHSLILIGFLPIVWAQDWNMPVDAPNPMKRGDQYWGQPTVAYVDPNKIKEMMVDRKSKKKVDVTLYISETETKVYTVERPTAASSQSDKYGVTDGNPFFDGTAMWPAVLELAIMAYAKDQSASGIATDLNGGLPNKAFEAIYGKTSFVEWIPRLTEERLTELLTTGKPTALTLYSKEVLVQHAYTVMFYNPDTKTVTIRNPWASIGTSEFTAEFDSYEPGSDAIAVTEDRDGVVAQKNGQFE
ncbi:hypothetical protein HD553DRAFT_337044 [Filobasidium floriforme]|uniref:uncharacterized protein n=1 Tax=Filobasidium floriforme TaxID=5210 RepID=UPI001E8DD33E|nr:uncharacterized protein HD553DRAFT_337044 [Filobasidium floriforme]KAH8079852.1 hypothetical protein HD553DRAFT_337044 [Filobasidium floriforme]